MALICIPFGLGTSHFVICLPPWVWVISFDRSSTLATSPWPQIHWCKILPNPMSWHRYVQEKFCLCNFQPPSSSLLVLIQKHHIPLSDSLNPKWHQKSSSWRSPSSSFLGLVKCTRMDFSEGQTYMTSICYPLQACVKIKRYSLEMVRENGSYSSVVLAVCHSWTWHLSTVRVRLGYLHSVTFPPWVWEIRLPLIRLRIL